VDPLFADWHRDISVDLTGVDIAAREQVADKIAEQAQATDAAALTALAYKRPSHAEYLTSFREQFKAAETTFRMRSNDEEIAMLAAAILQQICKRTDPTGIIASYLVLVANDNGWTCALSEAPAAAMASLASGAAAARTLTPVPTLSPLSAIPEPVAELPAGSVPALDFEAFRQSANLLVQNTQSAIASLHGQLGSVLTWAKRAVDVPGEESNVLWWLVSGHSASGPSWSELPPKTAAILAGRELADRIAVHPAPPQWADLLGQLLSATKPTGKATDSPTPLQAPPELEFVIVDLPGDLTTAVESLATISLHQALLVRAWRQFA
jgi:hypothetical protein